MVLNDIVLVSNMAVKLPIKMKVTFHFLVDKVLVRQLSGLIAMPLMVNSRQPPPLRSRMRHAFQFAAHVKVLVA
jgi:hypothetical protein